MGEESCAHSFCLCVFNILTSYQLKRLQTATIFSNFPAETKASIERKKKITSNQPTVSSNSKAKATHSISSKSFEKPITPSLQNKSHPPGISSKQQDKDLVSLPLTHKPPNASLSIIRARSGSRIGRDQQTRGDQFVTKKIENVRNAKNLNEEKERAFEEDSSVVQGLLNHMVVQVLEQRPDSAMAGQFGLNREKVSFFVPICLPLPFLCFNFWPSNEMPRS